MGSSDSILHLSSFNSIFELLVSFSLAYGGLTFFSEFLNEQFRTKSQKLHEDIIKDFYFIDEVRAVIKISEKVRHFHTIDGFKHAARQKMIPIFLFGGFFSFTILVIAALSDSPFQEIIIGSGRKINISPEILFYSIIFWLCFLSLGIFTLLIFNSRGFFTLNFYLFKLRIVISTFSIIFSVLLLCFISFFLNYLLGDIIKTYSSQYFYQLLIVFFAIFIGICPIIFFEIWANPYSNARLLCLKKLKKDLDIYLFYQAFRRVPNVSPDEIRRIRARFLCANDADFHVFLSSFKKDVVSNAIYLYKRYLIAGALTLFCLLTVLYIFKPIARKKNIPQTVIDRTQIESILDSAATKEMRIYKSYQKPDTSWFNKYFAKGSKEKYKILGVIKERKKDKFIITNDSVSVYRFYGVREMSLEKGVLFVKSREYWCLRWYDPKNKKYIYQYQTKISEPVNYELVKEGGTWKIKTSDYVGDRKYL